MDQYLLCSRLLLVLRSPDERKRFNTVHPQSRCPEDSGGWGAAAGPPGHLSVHSLTSVQLCLSPTGQLFTEIHSVPGPVLESQG